MLEIEITESGIIEGGLEVFARAWQDGVQIGFGKNGTIDIERFKIINPPVLVEDENGDVIVTSEQEQLDGTTVTLERRYREDPEESTLQVLEHVISVKKEKIVGSDSIIPDSVGKTTSTIYTEAGDGYIRNNESTFSASRSDTVGNLVDSTTSDINIARSIYTGGQYYIQRSFWPFDTSSIPDGDTISSATFSVYILSKSETNAGQGDVCLIETTQSSTSTIVAGDYDNITLDSPDEGATRAEHSTISTSAYLDMAMNATGIGWIDKTGDTKLGIRISGDVDDSAPTGENVVAGRTVERTGTSNDPKLVVEHAVASSTFTPTMMTF